MHKGTPRDMCEDMTYADTHTDCSSETRLVHISRDMCMIIDWKRRTHEGLLTSNDNCAIFSNRVTSTEGVGGEMEGGESLAGNVIDRANLCLAITELQHIHVRVSTSRKKNKKKKSEKYAFRRQLNEKPIF